LLRDFCAIWRTTSKPSFHDKEDPDVDTDAARRIFRRNNKPQPTPAASNNTKGAQNFHDDSDFDSKASVDIDPGMMVMKKLWPNPEAKSVGVVAKVPPLFLNSKTLPLPSVMNRLP